MKSDNAPPGHFHEGMRQNRFLFWICASLIIHTVGIASFIRIENTSEFVRNKQNPGLSGIDSMHKAFDRNKWTGTVTQFQEDAQKVRGDGSPDPASIFDTMVPYFDESGPENAEWLNAMADLPEDLVDRLQNEPSSKTRDSLFSVCEMLRQMLVEQILQGMRQDTSGAYKGPIDWKKLAESLANMLREQGTNKNALTSSPGSLDSLIARALQEQAMQKLWEQAMLFSLRNEAWKQLSSSMKQAIIAALAMECGNSGVKTGNCGSGAGDGDDDAPLPSSGDGGSYIGFDPSSSRRFEAKLKRQLLGIARSKGLGNLASLFPPDELRKRLSDLARESIRRGRGGNTEAAAWANSIAIEKIINETIIVPRNSTADARQKTDALFSTISKALGDKITGRLSWLPTPQELKRNPGYFNEWAKSYWDMIRMMSTAPNLIIPNLDNYAQAARKMRNRALPWTSDLLVGTAQPVKISELPYFTPKKVYLARDSARAKYRETEPLVPAEFPAHAWGAAVRRTRPVVLDGVLDEWNDCRPYALWGTTQGTGKLPPLLRNQNFLLVQWDNTGLYFAYRINDARDNPGRIDLFWMTDALELFLDPQNAKDSVRIEGKNCQFWLWPRAGRSAGCTGQSIFETPWRFKPMVLKDDQIRFASQRTGDSYGVEAFLPSSLVPAWYPLPGKIIGFNYSINNGEMVLIRWVTNKGKLESHHPNLWGDLLLMGTNAKMTFSPAEGIVPGQSLAITVRDPDMNLDALRPDLAWVVVNSRLSGDSFPLSLKETGDDTGIFTGTLFTVFGIKAKLQDRLSVRPGDMIDVEYLDQNASGGKKAVQIREAIEVARGVFSFVK
jgi:hypothetical protein